MSASTSNVPHAQHRWIGTVSAYVPLLLGIGCLAWANSFSTHPVVLESPIPARAQLALLYAGSALVAWGAAGSPRLGQEVPKLRRDRRFSRDTLLELLAITLIMVAALALRFGGLETSMRLLLDEMNYVTGVGRVLSSPDLLILHPMSDVSPFPWLYSLLQADSVAVFGRTLTGLRGASVLIGTATVLLTYGIARMLFNRRAALIALVVIATFPPHLHFSRIAASMTTADAFFGMLNFAWVVRALKTGKPLDWSIAGVTFGWIHYFSDGGKLVFTLLMPVYLGWLALMNKPLRPNIRRGIGRMAIIGVIIAAPIYTTLLMHGKPIMGRWGDTNMGGLSYYLLQMRDGLSEEEIRYDLDRLTAPFRFIALEPEAQAVYYAGTEPLVMRVFVPLLLLGMVAVLLRWRKPEIFLVAVVLVTALGNGIFIWNPASSPRFVIVMPALALLIALGVAALESVLARLRVPARWRLGFVVILTSAIAVIHVTYYFGPHLEHLRYHHRRGLTYGDIWDAVQRVNDTLPSNTQGIYVGNPAPPPNESSELLGFFQGGNHYPFMSFAPDALMPRNLSELKRDRGYAFLIETRYQATISMIYRYFPDAAPPGYTPWEIAPNEQYLLIYVPPPDP